MTIINSTLRHCGFILQFTFIFSVALSQTEKQKGISQALSTQVKTESGILEGVRLKSGIVVFRGIPYAAPPVWKFAVEGAAACYPVVGCEKSRQIRTSCHSG